MKIEPNKEQKKLIKDLAKIAYPDYNGRKFSICVETTYYMNNFWSDGSRNYCVAVDLLTGKIQEPTSSSSTPWSNTANVVVTIPTGVGILERCIFCGKDLGIRLYVAPNNSLQMPTTQRHIDCDCMSCLPPTY
jgi:hypothetical protein